MNTTTFPQVCKSVKGCKHSSQSHRTGRMLGWAQRARRAFLPSTLWPAFLSTIMCSSLPLQYSEKEQEADRNLDIFNHKGWLVFNLDFSVNYYS